MDDGEHRYFPGNLLFASPQEVTVVVNSVNEIKGA